jgi:hypothetical protein
MFERSVAQLTILVALVAGQATPLGAAPFGGRRELAQMFSTHDVVPALWRDPGQIEQLDFAKGPGGPRGRPQPPFQFVRESLAGTNAKIRVVDANRIQWMVKFGEEVRPQTFAVRLAWALGYFALPIYFIASGTVIGVTPLTRAAKYVTPDGRFRNASFELYLDSGVQWLGDAQSWRWDANPFVGTHQLKGLKILVMLLSDWDNKDARDLTDSWTTAGTPGSNNAIFVFPSGEARYVVTDWGASMGTWGSYFTRSKWNCVGFELQTQDFVKTVGGDVLQWGYLGRHTQDFIDDIDRDDVRWLLTYLDRISDRQVQDGLLASGATPVQARCFGTALRKRITALQALR